LLESRLDGFSGTPHTQASHGNPAEEDNEIEQLKKHSATEQAPLPARPISPCIGTTLSSGAWNVRLIGSHGVSDDIVSEAEERWEAVGELHDGDSGYEGGYGLDLWNGGTNDEGENPVNTNQNRPDNAPFLGHESGTFHPTLNNIDIEDLYADVSIKASGDNSSDEGKDVTQSLP